MRSSIAPFPSRRTDAGSMPPRWRPIRVEDSPSILLPPGCSSRPTGSAPGAPLHLGGLRLRSSATEAARIWNEHDRGTHGRHRRADWRRPGCGNGRRGDRSLGEQRHARHRSVLESRAERPSFPARLGAAILRVARRDRHSLTNYPCLLLEGKIGRTAVVLSGGDWTLVSRVASSRLHRRTRRLTATPGSDGTRPGVRGRTCQTRPARVPARGARLRRYGQGGREPGAPPARRPDTVATASRRANGETDPPLQN